MKERGNSREFFYLKEKKLFKPLPLGDYKVFSFKKAKVHPDCHVQLNHNFYSVPYVHVGKEVTVKFNQNLVQVVVGSEVVATHTTRRGTGQLSTNTDHYPEKKWVEESYLTQSLFKKAKSIGEQTLLLVEHLFSAQKHPLKNLRKVQAVLSLKSQFSNEALEYASENCLRFEKYSHGFVKSCCKTYLLKEKKKTNTVTKKAPNRSEHLVCLQGGKD